MKISTLFATAICVLTLNAQAQTDKATTAKIVPAKTYTFVAQSASPLNAAEIGKVMGKMSGGSQSGTIQLTETYYTVKVTPDSIIAYLPYYGRAYQAKPNTSEGGIKFTSTKFSYLDQKTKKGTWDIKIQTKDQNDAYQLSFHIGKDGYASLSLNSNSKQAISYNGILKENK